MPIIDIPYFYQAEVVLKGKRKAQMVNIMDVYPFEYESATNAEPVAELNISPSYDDKKCAIYKIDDNMVAPLFNKNDDTFKMEYLTIDVIKDLAKNMKIFHDDMFINPIIDNDLFIWPDSELVTFLDRSDNAIKSIQSDNQHFIFNQLKERLDKVHVFNNVVFMKDIIPVVFPYKIEPFNPAGDNAIYDRGAKITHNRGDTIDPYMDHIAIPLIMPEIMKTMKSSQRENSDIIPDFDKMNVTIHNPELKKEYCEQMDLDMFLSDNMRICLQKIEPFLYVSLAKRWKSTPALFDELRKLSTQTFISQDERNMLKDIFEETFRNETISQKLKEMNDMYLFTNPRMRTNDRQYKILDYIQKNIKLTLDVEEYIHKAFNNITLDNVSKMKP